VRAFLCLYIALIKLGSIPIITNAAATKTLTTTKRLHYSGHGIRWKRKDCFTWSFYNPSKTRTMLLRTFLYSDP